MGDKTGKTKEQYAKESIKAAKKVLGDEGKWEIIYEANKAEIKDPNLIYKGQILVAVSSLKDLLDIHMLPHFQK